MAVSNYINNGGFGLTSFNNAKNAGYSDKDIYNFLSGWGGTIGDQVRTNMAAFNSQQAQEQQALGLQSYQRALASGQTPQQFFDYAKGSGLTIGEGLQAEMDKYNSSQMTIKDRALQAKDLRGALRIFGSEGERQLGTNTLAQLAKEYKTDESNIIKQLDIVNKNQGTKLGIGSNAINSIIKNQEPGWAYDSYLSKLSGSGGAYGDGKVGQAITQYRDSAYTLKPGEGMTLGSSDERAKAQSAAGLIPLQGSKYVIDSRGNYVPRVSNAPTSNTATNSYVPPTFQGTSGTSGTVDVDPTPQPPTVPDPTVFANQSGGRSDLSSAAANWRGKRSNRSRQGPNAQGYKSFINAPRNAANVGTNVGSFNGFK
jgi:hypothetical protein